MSIWKRLFASVRQAVEQEAAAKALLPEIMRLMSTHDAKEGVQSFLERRSANFTGS